MHGFSKQTYSFLLLCSLPYIIFAQASNDSLYSIEENIRFESEATISSAVYANVVVGPFVRGAVTDSSGYFKIDSLKTGTYNLSISLIGFERVDTSITIVNQSLSGIDFTLLPFCRVNRQMAEHEIKLKEARLLLVGGIAPIVYTNQHLFEKKYEVSYYDFGCIGCPEESIIEYNHTVFEYLDKRFGKKWRKEIRKDVVGFKEWTKISK